MIAASSQTWVTYRRMRKNPEITVDTMQAYLKGEIRNQARWLDELSRRMPPVLLPVCSARLRKVKRRSDPASINNNGDKLSVSNSSSVGLFLVSLRLW